ncbi:putative short-chain dehydrogenase [Pseudomonas aeruginosa]|nr:putative short-chain dehydrogenase [Pseudomonas aeruginosa]
MNDFPKWNGQVALISGAGSEHGIGFAIARRLAREGVRLLITASSERIRQRAEELSACGHEVRAAAADLTDEAQVRGLLDWAEAQWGRVDILVNNAGMAQLGSAEPFSAVEATSLRDWQLSLSRNLTSAFLLTRGLLPGMRERGYGRIVNVASTTGTRGSNPGEAAV